MNPLGLLGINIPILSSVYGLISVLVIWFVASRWKPLRDALRFLIGLLPAAVLSLVGLLAIPLWRPVGWATELLLRVLPLDRLVAWTLRLPERVARSPLLRGERRAYAERVWPPAAFPDLYQPIPADLARPSWEDGRLLGGVPVTWLADRHLTDGAFRSAVRAGLKAGVLVFLLGFLLLLLGTLLSILAFFPALFRGDKPILEQWPGEEPIRASAWSLLSANVGHATADLMRELGAVLVNLPAAAAAAAGVAILIALLLLRGWMQEKGAPYELVTKDAEVRWPYRIETRNLLRQTYRRQLEHAAGSKLKGLPTYKVGTATGTLRARGDLSAPTAGQPVLLDSESLFQHTLVFGGTGEGKTRALLRPLLRQVLADRRFGAFIADAKGELWMEARRIAEEVGRSADVVVIGAGDGQAGVDLTADLTPAQIAATLRSVLQQVGSGGGDSFWPSMATTVLRHMLTIGRGYSQTEAGAAETAKGLNPYSLWWAYQAVLRPELASTAIDHIKATYGILREQAAAEPELADDRLAKAKAMMPPELRDSVAYVQSAWRDMAEETKTGIIANVTNLMDGFGSSAPLRERFVSGRSEGAVGVRAALEGKIVLVALSSIEDGLPARLSTILLKTSLYREARRRESELKALSPKRDPQDVPCLVVMDEVQELVTVDPSSGLSDATFWNVARSTGLAGVFATQTISALRQAMGESAADNFVQQARSKVFFRSEEQKTIDFACWCAGAFERNRVFEAGQRESLEYRELIDGWTPLNPIDEQEELRGGARAFFGAARSLLFASRTGVGRATAREAYSPDLRFIPRDATSGSAGLGASSGDPGNAASMGALAAAHWRAEDLNRDYRASGNEQVAALAPSDLIHMGRWHAFAHVQRAGAVRQDLITVEHDLT